jgi:membrane protease YdiL (CAAX protease family)
MNTPVEALGMQLKPLQRWESLLFFGFPTLLMLVSVYFILPSLTSLGASEYLGLQLASLIPYLTLFVGALVAYRREKNPWSWTAFQDRFRLNRLSGQDWLWVLALIIFSFASYLMLRSLVSTLVSNNFFALPASVPRIIDPRLQLSLEELAGGTLKGNWLLVVISVLVLFFNIFGEELWWRGYLLPRQEVVYGRSAWIMHGLLWTFFHVFKYWELIAILPVSLALSFVVQYRRNTWFGILAHLAVNSLGTIGLLLSVIG